MDGIVGQLQFSAIYKDFSRTSRSQKTSLSKLSTVSSKNRVKTLISGDGVESKEVNSPTI